MTDTRVADDDLGRRLADQMRSAVADVAVDDLMPRLRARRARQRRTGYGVAAALAVVIAVAAVSLGSGDRPVEPPVAPRPRPPLSSASHSRFDVTYLPPGFAVMYVGFQGRPQGGETERINFGPPVADGSPPRQVIILLAEPGDDPVSVSDYVAPGQHPKAVRIGTRDVVHLRTAPSPDGLSIYAWTEEPGLNVSVDGRGGVPDAELRRFVAGLRLRPEAPLFREPYGGRVVAPVTVPWLSADFAPDGTAELAYLATDAACRVLHDVRVSESASAVTITLVEATPEERAADAPACPDRGVTAKVRVRPPSPLDGRRLLDGSVTPSRPRSQ